MAVGLEVVVVEDLEVAVVVGALEEEEVVEDEVSEVCSFFWSSADVNLSEPQSECVIILLAGGR